MFLTLKLLHLISILSVSVQQQLHFQLTLQFYFYSISL